MNGGADLTGRRILVTAANGERLSALLRERGAVPLAVPTIATRPLTGEEVDDALRRAFGPSDPDAAGWDWIVVTSPAGATAALDRLDALGLEVPAATRWAAVGPATEAELTARGVRVALVPAEGRGIAIASAIERGGAIEGRRILLLRSRSAGRDLPRLLAARGAAVEEIPVYETIEGPDPSREPLRTAIEGGIDAAVFTSGSTVRGFLRLADDPRFLDGVPLVAIGPSTARAIEGAGFRLAAIASARTPEALAEAVETALEAAIA